jgi:hypothetical protein
MSPNRKLKSLKAAFLNVGGLITHGLDKTKDPHFLNTIKKYDMVFLAETHTSKNKPPRVEGFHVHAVSRPNARHNNRNFGGLCILLKDNISSHVQIMKNTSDDFQWIQLDQQYFGLSRNLYICVIYNPPATSSYSIGLDYNILECLEKDMLFYNNSGDVLLCGDFNARTSNCNDFISNDDNMYIPVFEQYKIDKEIRKRESQDSRIDNRGKDLLDLCISQNMRILNGRTFGDSFGKLTCFTPGGSSTVDYVIVSENFYDQILNFCVDNFDPTLSDCHCLLYWEFSANFVIQQDILFKSCKTSYLEPRFIWSEDSAFRFQEALLSYDIQQKVICFENEHIDNCQISLDNASSTLNNILTKAASMSLTQRKKNKKTNKNKSTNKKWFDADLRYLKTRLVDYGKVLSRYPMDAQVRGHFYKLRKKYTKLCKFKRRQHKQNILDKLSSLHEENPKLYWNMINELRNEDSINPDTSISPSRWLDHFKTLNQRNESFSSRLNDLKEQLASMEKSLCFNELDNLITTKEISHAISRLKCGKAPGLDNISNNMIKYGQNVLLPCLLKIFNACLSYGLYPTSWAQGYITPLHKSGDSNNTNNYRGITITSAVGKLFNSILNSRLDSFLEKNNIINSCQIGFSKKARTSDHMFILRTLFNTYCEKNEGRLYACFVDFKKAFDTVIHVGIKLKLLQIGVGSRFYNVIDSMYKLSNSCVRLKDQITDCFPVKLGVKQGDNLSPNLFKIFINDLPTYMQNTDDSVSLNDNLIHCLMYADDVVLLSSSPMGLQQKLNCLAKFCKDWGLTVNTSKTKILIFNKAGRHISHKFLMDSEHLECVKSYKYLGVYFTASGSFSLAQEEMYKKALKAYFKLQKDFLNLNPGVKNSTHIFDHTIKPILLYGCEIWGSFNSQTARFRNNSLQLDEIYSKALCEKLHIKFCRYILGVHKKSAKFAVLAELGRFPMGYNIISQMLNYWHRLENLDDSFPLLQTAYNADKLNFQNKLSSWCGSVNLLFRYFPELMKLQHATSSLFKTKCKKYLQEQFLNNWYKKKDILSSTGKLDTYCKIKQYFGLENYLTILKNFTQRKTLTRFRISAHKLRIESGRYLGMSRTSRICLNCTLNEVEDEIHFLFKCPKNSTIRELLFLKIQNICQLFINLTLFNKLIWLLNCEDIDILHILCQMLTM